MNKDVHGISPGPLAERAFPEWDRAFMFTCACQPRETRFEAAGMCCAKCDKPIVRRRSA
ncbi:MAG TPA: hypothetical protein VGM06_10500 [Polyangiaceae bacterium]|jgi:hypothetical protein